MRLWQGSSTGTLKVSAAAWCCNSPAKTERKSIWLILFPLAQRVAEVSRLYFPLRELVPSREKWLGGGACGKHRPQPLLGPTARGEQIDWTPLLLWHPGSSAQLLPPSYTAIPVKATQEPPRGAGACLAISPPQALLLCQFGIFR